MSLIEVKLRPTGPWRVGDRAGDRGRVGVVYHSDALFSAFTHAMRALGWLEEWLEATARAPGAPVVRFSSLFPFVGKTRLVAPPKSAWPPANPGRLYLQGAKLVPLEIVKSGVVEESRWQVDGASECLVPVGGSAPFQVSMRTAAAVDRVTGATEPHRTACLEFGSNAGWWGVFEVSDAAWEARVKSAWRLLADSGFGGERSRGWGRASEPHFSDGSHLFAPAAVASNHKESNHKNGMLWLLSLYSPHESDVVDWARGEYSASVRGGWTDSLAGAGPKKQVRMIEEGSVLSSAALRGQAVDVAPDGFAHPVYRAGFALAMPAAGEIVVRTVETARPARVVPEIVSKDEGVPAEPVIVPEPGVVPEPESGVVPEPVIVPEPGVVPEPEAAGGAVDSLVADEPLVTPGEDAAGVRVSSAVPAEGVIASEQFETPAPESSEAAGQPVITPEPETESPVDSFVAEEPLVTPGEDASSVRVSSPVEAEPVITAEPEVVAEPPVVPEPFAVPEPELPEGSVEPVIVPRSEADSTPEPQMAENDVSSFVAEEPLVTPGDDAPVKPDEVAE